MKCSELSVTGVLLVLDIWRQNGVEPCHIQAAQQTCCSGQCVSEAARDFEQRGEFKRVSREIVL